MEEVTGKVTYFERIAAPPNARLEVVLEDVSRPGLPAERVGEMVIQPAGQPPYDFRIEYDPSEIDPRHTYRVAARLYDRAELLFVSDQIHQVITRGFPTTVDVRMRSVERPTPHPLGELPASFAGTFACADCRDVDVRLDLLANGVFFLREQRAGHDNGTSYDIGRYLVSSGHEQMALYGGREAPMLFAITGPDSLRRIYPDGTHRGHALSRQSRLPLLQPRLRLRGQYRYMADAGRLRECLTGMDLPVAAEGDNRALQEAYLAARESPGQALMVNLEGRIEQRPPMEGAGLVPTLIPERFKDVRPDLDCPEPVSAATLENTYWRLILLGYSAIERFTNQREPHLIFRESGQLAGSDGCSRLAGQYEARGRNIGFSNLAATALMCARGMDQAQAFRDALRRAHRFRILGNVLDIFDARENLLMRLEAVALK